MPWDDIATKMTAEDAEKGRFSNWTHAAVYNRWCRNAKQIHKKYFKHDKGFNYLKFKYQKKERSDAKKRNKASRATKAKVGKEEEREEEENELMDEDEEMLEQLEEDQKSDRPNAGDELSAQSDHAGSKASLTTSTVDLTTLRSCHDQVRDAQKAELWSLVADRMNERAVGDESEISGEKKRWSAEDCEAAMQAGSA